MFNFKQAKLKRRTPSTVGTHVHFIGIVVSVQVGPTGLAPLVTPSR